MRFRTAAVPASFWFVEHWKPDSHGLRLSSNEGRRSIRQPEVSCGRVQVFRYSTIIQSSNHLLHIYLFSLGFHRFHSNIFNHWTSDINAPVKLLRLFSTKWLALSTWKWHEATISLLSSWCSYGLAQSPCSPSLVQPGPDDLSNKFESWGDWLVEFLLEKFVSKFLVLFRLCHLYCRGRLWKQSLNHFVLQKLWNHLGSLARLKGQLWWCQLGTQATALAALRCRRWVPQEKKSTPVSIVGRAWKA